MRYDTALTYVCKLSDKKIKEKLLKNFILNHNFLPEEEICFEYIRNNYYYSKILNLENYYTFIRFAKNRKLNKTEKLVKEAINIKGSVFEEIQKIGIDFKKKDF